MKSWLITVLRVLTALLLTGPNLKAAATIVDYTVNSIVPDNNPTGLADTQTITGSTITAITGIEVRLKLIGGWNGDLYAFLQHASGFSVLLNRSGKTSGDPIGSGSSGFDITLSGDAVTDIHTGIGNSGLITGLYQPDARNIDPDLVTDVDPRTAYLSSFQGLNANGSWTLFVADNAVGDESTLVSWGLTIRGTGTSPQALFNAWAAGLSGPDAQALATPFHDGVNNLTKYAFNLNPLGSDVRPLTFGTGGTAGLPDCRITENATSVTLEVEYLRNTVSGLLYTPEYSTNLEPGTFIPMTGPVTVTPIDACWERIVASQVLDRATTQRGFARVAVQLP